MTCTLSSSADEPNDWTPCTSKWTSEPRNNDSASSCCSDESSHTNNGDYCSFSRSHRPDNSHRSCACLADTQIRNNGYRICGKEARREKASLLRGIMAWMSSNSCEPRSTHVHRRRRRSAVQGSRPGGTPGRAALLLALCVTGMAISRGGMGVAAARLPIIDEGYRPNGGDPGVIGNPGNLEIDPAGLGSVAEQQQALLEYLEEPSIQSQMYTQQQLMQLALRLRENPDLLAQIMALNPAARRYSLTDEVIARMPSAGGLEATPAPPQPKRGNYMALCHFKICNMGRKRRQEP